MAKEDEQSTFKSRLGVDVSIILVVYNQLLSLKLILRSIQAQDFAGCKEVIITDDGSNVELFSKVRKDFDKADIPIKYVWQQDKGVRPAEARNNGIKLASGNYLLFLDGDMVPTIDLVRKHMEGHKQEKLLIAGSRKWRGQISSEIADSIEAKPIEVVLHQLESEWPIDEDSSKREKTERKRRSDWLDSSSPWRACFSGNLSVQRAPEVLFDENYVGFGNEDWELSYKLCMLHGYKPVYKDDASAYHLETPQSVSNVYRGGRHEDIVLHMRNICYFFDKCPGLELEDVFLGFPRLELDESTNKWKVVSRQPNYSRQLLEQKVLQVRKWLSENGIY